MSIIGNISQEDIDHEVKIIDLLMAHGYRFIEAARFCCSYNAYSELINLINEKRTICKATIDRIIEENHVHI